MVFVFIWFWNFGLAWATGLSVLFLSTCVLDTDAGWESIPHMSAFVRFSLSVDTVIVGEVDELEEDVG